jgi:hypothetical protein
LLSDAFHFAISMTFKLREPKNAPSFQTLMKEDSNVALEFICLTSNIRKEVCEGLDSFLSFLKKFDERKTHNMLALLLNSRFKNLCFVSTFIGHDQGVTFVGNVIQCHYILCS